jgi:hypothetical protein
VPGRAARPALARLQGAWSDRPVDGRAQTFVFEGITVTLVLPEGAAFVELEGLDPPARHLTWAPAPGGFFLLSAGTSPGHTPEGLLAGEEAPEVLADDPAPSAGPGARRLTYRVVRHRPRELREAPGGGTTAVPERTVSELSDLLFVPGPHLHLRLGYRVEADAAAELQAQLREVLDRAQVVIAGA